LIQPMWRSLSILLLLICSLLPLYSQDPSIREDPEQEFNRMRELAAAGDYAAAIRTGTRLLEENPGYYDVALYLARVYGWESEFDSAWAVLDPVLEKEPDLYEAFATCADLAYWEHNREKLDSCAARASELEPDSAVLFDSYKTALKESLPEAGTPELFAFYSYDHFSVPYRRHWHMLTAGGEVPFDRGKLIPSLNAGYHAGGDFPGADLQVNLDAYLTLGSRNYLLLGYGISPNGSHDYFPGHRGVAELWQVLPAGFALSGGLRYFYWDRHFTYLTFSAEKYAGNYWFALRNYLFFKEYGTSASFYLSARRYFSQVTDYLTLILGYGTAPDEPILVVSDLDRLNAVSGRIEYSRPWNSRIRLLAMAGYSREEYADRQYRNRFLFKAGAYFRIIR
jgi:YaiO family outer membrane protein